MRTATSIIGISLLMLWAMDANAADGGAPDGGQPDSGTDYCVTVSDDCCIDNGSDDEVLASSGCNGQFDGPAQEGETGGECGFDPDEGALGNCDGIDVCWPYPNWYSQYPAATGGECGLCLTWCTELGGCPDGFNEDPDTYDFCASDCPDGMRCWVYDYAGSSRGICVADCITGDQCSSGVCDPLWNICVPRIDSCEQTTDTDPDSGPDEDGGQTFDLGGKASSGCMCTQVEGADPGGLLVILAGLLGA